MFLNSFRFVNEQIFTIDALVPIFEYFEALCWKSMKNNILPDYQLKMPEKANKNIIDYFESNKNENKLININNFTAALRKLISRALTGSRQEVEIKAENKLKLYLEKEELWEKQITKKEEFEKEINDICKDDLIIGYCLDLYDSLGGDNILKKEMFWDNNENDEDNIEEEGKNEDEQLDNDEIREEL